MHMYVYGGYLLQNMVSMEWMKIIQNNKNAFINLTTYHLPIIHFILVDTCYNNVIFTIYLCIFLFFIIHWWPTGLIIIIIRARKVVKLYCIVFIIIIA